MRIVGGRLGLLVAVALGAVGVILVLDKGDAGAEQDIDIDFWDVATIDADILGVALILIAGVLVVVCSRAFRREP